MRWQPGDIVGCAIDIDKRKCRFYLNGTLYGDAVVFGEEVHSSDAFYPSASFTCFQQATFNFGPSALQAAPEGYQYVTAPALSEEEVRTLNEAQLAIRRFLRPQGQILSASQMSLNSQKCIICFDKPPNIQLLPCMHEGFCSNCAAMLNQCPVCRTSIAAVHPMPPPV